MNKDQVFQSITAILQNHYKNGNYQKAAVSCTKYAIRIISTDKRLASVNGHLNWNKIRNEVFRYLYTAIMLKDLHEPGSWAGASWLTETTEVMREELVPKLCRYRGRVFCKLSAGFHGVKSGKISKKTKK